MNNPANPFHVDVVRSGKKAIARFRRTWPTAKLNLAGANFIAEDLSGLDLDEAIFDGATLIGASLEGSNLRGATFKNVRAIGTIFIGADLRYASFEDCKLDGATMRGAAVISTRFSRCSLQVIDWEMANLNLAEFITCDHSGSSMEQTSAHGARFIRGCIFHGFSAIRCDFDSSVFDESDLSRCRMVADLSNCSFRGCIIEGFDPHGSVMHFTDFREARGEISEGSLALSPRNIAMKRNDVLSPYKLEEPQAWPVPKELRPDDDAQKALPAPKPPLMLPPPEDSDPE